MKLIKADYIVIFAIVLYSITLFATNFFINYKMELAKQIKIEKEIVLIAEQNPLARAFLLFQNYKYIYLTIIMPAFIVSLYYYLRNKYLKINPELVEAVAIFFAISYFYNVINDVSILLGAILQ